VPIHRVWGVGVAKDLTHDGIWHLTPIQRPSNLMVAGKDKLEVMVKCL